MDILIVNLNCLSHTKNLIDDLNYQSYKNFKLTVIDQNSRELGTSDFLDDLQASGIRVIKNQYNVPLNSVWNNFVESSTSDYIAILNNDIRITSNFISDNVNILDNNLNVGAVMHPTNHPTYKSSCNEIMFDILPTAKHRQGWDICMRKKLWVTIPDILKIYCGDDFIFEHMYRQGYEYAVATSSPIVHYLGQTRKSSFNINLPELKPMDDIANYRALGYTHYMVPPSNYTIVNFDQSPVNFIEDINNGRKCGK